MRYPTYKIVLAIGDFLVVRSAFLLAFQIQEVLKLHWHNYLDFLCSNESMFLFFYTLVIVFIFQNHRLYKYDCFLNFNRQLKELLISFLYAVIGLLIFAFFLQSTWLLDNRINVISFTIIAFCAVLFYRVCIFRPVISFLRKNQFIPRNTIIVGTNIDAKSYAAKIEYGNIYGLKLVGFVGDDLPSQTNVYKHYSVLGTFEEIELVVQKYHVQEIIVTLTNILYEELLEVIDRCHATGVNVRITSSQFHVVHDNDYSETFFGIPIVHLMNTDHLYNGMLKRMFDIFFATVGLVLLFIPFIIFALLIKATSKGPIFYRQSRIGKEGQPFEFYKFRTMYVGSDDDENRINHVTQFIRNGTTKGAEGTKKIVNESLITPVGRLLRRTSIDELPQLYNVLKGDMSIVGPRPCLPYEYKVYDEWHKRRLNVSPGCTGIWQVSARSTVCFDDMVILDLFYIDHMTLMMDISLILKTIPVMLFGKGGK
ncbi:MAG: sugar transferase [Bacteroidota bacterium]